MITLSKSILTQQIFNVKFLLSLEKHLIRTTNNRYSKKKSKTKLRKTKKSNDLMTSINNTAEAATVSRISELSSIPVISAAAAATTASLQLSDKIYTEYRCFENNDEEQTKMHINEQSCMNKNGIQFTVMSYNILAQDLLELHPYLYQNNPPEVLEWEYRLDKISKEILALQPEILCLQEVQQDHLKMVFEKLKSLNFDYVYKKKTGIRTDGCAIFYNKDLFNLIEKQSVEFYQPNIEHLDRENVAIIAKFSLKAYPNTRFLVSTTHLLYNPRRQDVRLAQVQVLLAELDRLSIKEIHENEPQRIPIILTGDFNLQPYSAPYRLITRGNLYYYNLTHHTLEIPSSNSYNQVMGNVFLSPKLGITDKCQHIDLISNKYQGKTRLRNTENEINSGKNHNHDMEIDDIDITEKYPNLFSSGKLSHNLNLISAYNHRTKDGDMEGTTFQQKWITVDYIFYSKIFNKKLNSACEGSLRLLSRYTLPSVQQCYKVGPIPNSYLGSDHFSLSAKFFLRTS